MLTGYWASLRRRRTPALITFVAALITSAAAAWLWPPGYEATGTILIEQQELPADLVRSTITSYADQRIQVISQRVMTTENLMGIMQRYDLYPRERRLRSREVVIAKMRKDVSFNMISADVMDPRQGRATKANIAFSVSYRAPTPALASKVANELVSLYLKENLDSRKQSSDDAAAFLNEEGTKLTDEITASQQKLADFKAQHADELPDLNMLNQQLSTRTEEEIRDTDTQLRALDQQLTLLDAQLAQINPTAQIYASTGERVQSPSDRLKYLRSEYARLSAIYAPDHPDVLRTKREIDGLQSSVGDSADENDLRRQLEQTNTQLASARQRYAPDHPDVLQLERAAASLQQQLDAARIADADNRGATDKSAHANAASSGADNPVYIQIRSQRDAAASQRASLLKKRAQSSATLADYENRLAQMPAVERDYTAIMQELDSEQSKYREIRARLLEAQLAQNLESEQKGERFTLIEPPVEPQEPSSPNRGLVLLLGLVGGLLASFGVVALLESLDSTVRGRDVVEQILGVAPLAVIPWLNSEVDALRRRRRAQLMAAGAVGSVVVAVTLVHVLYRPLDVLWFVVLRRLGIDV
jgi:uncharacterized protein involved in exopolysaccharide biosynthesis